MAGVDLGLDNLVVVVLSTKGERVDRFKTEHSQGGYQFLSTRLRRLVQSQQAGKVLLGTPHLAVGAGVEPTNYYWKQLATYLHHTCTTARCVRAITLSTGQSLYRQPPSGR